MGENGDAGRRKAVRRREPARTDSGETPAAVAPEDRRSAEHARARLAAVVAGSDDAILAKDLHGRITDWNAAAERMYGYSAEEAIGSPVAMLVPPERHREDVVLLRRVLSGGRVVHYETERLRKDGSRVPVSLTMSAVRDSDGLVMGGSIIARDVTERRAADADRAKLAALVLTSASAARAKAEAAAHTLHAAEQRFHAAFASAPIGMALIATTEEHGSRIEDVNPALCRLTGFARDELQGRDLVETLVHPADREPARRDVEGLLGGELSTAVAERRYIRRDGGDLWVETSLARLSEAPDDKEIVLQVQDITERKRSEERLRYLADHDPLTGVFNRRRFVEELDRETADGQRYGVSTAVLVLDVDHFKQVNDTYGHAVGDDVLAGVARALSERTRETDIVGRLGGDEFGVVLTHSDRRAAQTLAAALIEDLRERVLTLDDRRPLPVTVSVGIRAVDFDEELTADELIVEADIAMYEAKEGGRDRISAGGAGTERPTRLRRRLAMADYVRDALRRDDGFQLYEQPIRSLFSGQIERTEILVRMADPDGAVLLPAAFLPVADRFGLMPGVDRWVTAHAIELLMGRQAAGIELGMEVNLSGTSLGDPEVVDFIVASVRNAQIDPRALTFEVTETEAIVNIGRARLLSHQLANLGCQFALDNFGSGFGSFYYLKHLPFDVVKIDGDFVKALATSRTDQLTVKAMVEITRGMRKRTIAGYVRDRQTSEMLRGYGVDYAQGYHIGRPEPALARPRHASRSELAG
jgi:diguanylate cyclase (GGDEF)-like protein/PAS domain S-box-containing protein